MNNNRPGFTESDEKCSEFFGESYPGQLDKVREDLEKKLESIKRELKEMSPEVKLIKEEIIKVLIEKRIKFTCNEADNPKTLSLLFEPDNKPYGIDVILLGNNIVIRIEFSSRVEEQAIALVSMANAEINAGEPFSKISLNFEKGELVIEYSYICEKPEDFNGNAFWRYLLHTLVLANEEYSRLKRMAIGIVPKKDRPRYRRLLEGALKVLNWDFTEEAVYGTASMDSESDGENSEMGTNSGMNSGDEGFYEVDDDTIVFPRGGSSLGLGRDFPSFGEWMRMQEIQQGKSAAGNDDTDGKLEAFLNMLDEDCYEDINNQDCNEETGGENDG
ncbi:MAG: hypothetical protein K6E47_13045 [Lachnospiraceae bacterium]|nr:hypothetical protein [Lachnospiraceae bacterium]